jgi:hypothetical protein
MDAKYLVCNENTLCYRQDGVLGLLGVLAGKPQIGGRDWRSGSFAPAPSDKLRAATLADFDFFRVSPVGHIA